MEYNKYKYWMGDVTNFVTKRDDEPLVIGVDRKARNTIRRYIDVKGFDFDEFVEALMLPVNADIIEIYSTNVENTMGVLFTDGTLCDLTLPRNFVKNTFAKFLLRKDDTTFYYNLNYSKIIERIERKVGNFAIKATYFLFSQCIDFYKGSYLFASVKLDGNDFDICDKVADNIKGISYEGMYEFFKWFRPLTSSFISELTISIYTGEGKKITQKLEIKDGNVKQFIIEAKNEFFAYEMSGNWFAKVMGIKAVYDASVKKHRFEIFKDTRAFDMNVILTKINETISQMAESIGKISTINQKYTSSETPT